MKRFAIILVMILCFGMAACGNTGDNTPSTEGNRTEPTESTQTGATEGNQTQMHYLGLATLEEYEKHFSENGGYPDAFVTYEALRELGEFHSFVCQSYETDQDSQQKEYTEYQYSLAADGVDFELTVRPVENIPQVPEDQEWFDAEDTIIATDLRTNLTDCARANVTREKYQYDYLYGHLHSIEWTTGEFQIVISSENGWPEINPDSMLGRMLVLDTADAAITQLQQSIDSDLSKG